MVITQVRPLLIDRYLFVQIETDAGIVGLGESGAWAFLEASASAVTAMGRSLVGEDPLRIEHHWQNLYRAHHFRGAAIMGALSAIDIALWDIAGKHFGVPSYQLMGGKTRERARVYFHVRGETTEELVENCRVAKSLGMTAVGHLTPFLDEPRERPYFETHTQKMKRAIDRVRRYRDAVGDGVDLCIEIHRRLTAAEAVVLAEGIAPYHPFFYEDPVPPDNLDTMAEVAAKITVPIATGERLHTPQEFLMLVRRDAVQYVRPDVCICGGLTGAKKIAGIAEAAGIGVVPHNPLSPVSTAACIQLSACIPNFALQEYPTLEDEPPKSEIVRTEVHYDGQGFLIVPDVPGIGVTLVEGAAERYPFKPRLLRARRMTDGSVMDQ